MQDILNNVTVVLCNTSHTGNIGSVARAMKTMGLYKLILVEPKVLPDDHSIALASNAAEVVANATIVDNLFEAIKNTTVAVALTARRREFNTNLQTPRQIMPEILSIINKQQQVALVFGAEKTGLTISQLEQCNRLVTIPGNPEYSSLNLAQAVQIICYELYSSYNSNLDHLKDNHNLASIADNQGILTHLHQILHQIDYKYKNETVTKRNLQKIIYKANLERPEVDLIRGILGKIANKIA
jgi:tRNA/rRNA methyltransferase